MSISQNWLKDSIETVIKDNPKFVNEIAQGWIDVWMPKGSFMYLDTFWDDNIGGVNEKKVKEMIDDIVSNYKNRTIEESFAMNVQTLGSSPKFKEALIKDLSKKGYNAMVDEAGVGVDVVEGIDPLIVFDSNKSLEYKSTNRISNREETKSKKDYIKWRGNAQRARNRTGVW